MRKLSVLCVGDVQTTRRLTKLLQLEGHRVASATCCTQARYAGEADGFNVAIIDAHLPDGHAGDLLADLRALLPDLRGIVLDSAPTSPLLAFGFNAPLSPDNLESDIPSCLEDVIAMPSSRGKSFTRVGF